MPAEGKRVLLMKWWVNNKKLLFLNRCRSSTIAVSLMLLLGSQSHTHPKQLSSSALLICVLEEDKGDIKLEELPFLIRVAQYFSV